MSPELEERIRIDFANSGLDESAFSAFKRGYVMCLRRFGGMPRRARPSPDLAQRVVAKALIKEL